MLKLTALAIVAWLLVSLPNQSEEHHEQRTLCGRVLTEALSMLCEGNYNGPPDEHRIGKRDAPSPHRPGSVLNWILTVAGKKKQKLGPLQAYFRSRQKRGVVDECCKKSCPPSTLMSYCAYG